ncbi:cell surface protein [Deinococcus sp. Arct2-2]|uniref:cell surface protein n=1 Tax=Deinococcus sp. Arct2-2 TaxID=2568653 RepID=UPI0010A549DE|nr:cell surface protein [Deinococcus sp. Arct2-2]THF68682.1 cell surface protein [Deinococcus sp. Arct2-2]
MARFLVGSLLMTGLFLGSLSSCAPRQQAGTERFVTVAPVLYKVSAPVVRGGTLTVQGRSLGGPASAKIRMGVAFDGSGGFDLPAAAIQTWTADEITFTVPSDLPAGGGYIFILVGNSKSNGLPYSIAQ